MAVQTGFKPGKFDGLKDEAASPDSRGNIRDHTGIIELHVLANMENYSPIPLSNGPPQWQPVNGLTRTAAGRMKIFEETNLAAIRRLRTAASAIALPSERLPRKHKKGNGGPHFSMKRACGHLAAARLLTAFF